MKRFHIALAVGDLNSSIKDYSARLEQQPTVVVSDKYAMWRTDTLNFSINQIPDRAGQLRHVGFEDEAAQGFFQQLRYQRFGMGTVLATGTGSENY